MLGRDFSEPVRASSGRVGHWQLELEDLSGFPKKCDMADLKATSATALLSHGEVDEEDDLESALVQQWNGSFWKLALAAAGQDAPAANDVTVMTTLQSFTVITITDCPPACTTAMTHPANASACSGTVSLRTYYDLASNDAAKPTRHVEIQLPKGVTYSHGDHLAVMPMNSFHTVLRVAMCLGVDLDDTVMLGSAGGEELVHLPYNTPVNVQQLLLRHVYLFLQPSATPSWQRLQSMLRSLLSRQLFLLCQIRSLIWMTCAWFSFWSHLQASRSPCLTCSH